MNIDKGVKLKNSLINDHRIEIDDINETNTKHFQSAINSLKIEHDLFLHSAVSEAKSLVESELQINSRILVETLGQENLTALETQKSILENLRITEKERAQKDLNNLIIKHENALNNVNNENSKNLFRALEEQKIELNKSFEIILNKKERAYELSQDEAKAIHFMDRDQLLTSLSLQHEMALEKLRNENAR